MTQDTHPAWQIIPERDEDAPRIAALTEKSFGAGRYAKSAYRLREGVSAVRRLRFVAVDKDQPDLLYGSLRFWPIVVGHEASLLLGPLAVEPALRGQGIGIALMRHGIEESRKAGYASILLVGDEPYYVRVGFSRLVPGKVKFPGPVNPARVLGLSLKPNTLVTLNGMVRRGPVDDPVCACSTEIARP